MIGHVGTSLFSATGAPAPHRPSQSVTIGAYCRPVPMCLNTEIKATSRSVPSGAISGHFVSLVGRRQMNGPHTHDAAASSGVLAPPTDRPLVSQTDRQTDRRTNKQTNGSTVCNRDVPRTRAKRSNIEYMLPDNTTHRFFLGSFRPAVLHVADLMTRPITIRSTMTQRKCSELSRAMHYVKRENPRRAPMHNLHISKS